MKADAYFHQDVPAIGIGKLALAVGALAAGLLTGCGGGSGSADAGTSSSVNVFGTAATGLPIANAPVSIKCSSPSGAIINDSTTSDVNGAYNKTVMGAQAPCMVQIAYNNSNGVPVVLNGVALSAGTANITPLTHALLSSGLNVSDAKNFFSGLNATGIQTLRATRFDATWTALSNRLNTLGFATTGISNPLTDVFLADSAHVHQGHDGVLDAITTAGYFASQLVNLANGSTAFGTVQTGAAGRSTSGRSIATDASGNVYETGSTTGALDGNTLAGTQDFYITKYDGKGVKQFTRQLGVVGQSTHGQSVATDANGNVYVAGYTTGGLDGNVLTGTQDFFLTKYDSSGVKQFTRQLGVVGQQTTAQSVAVDGNGNVYVAGYTDMSLPGPVPPGAGYSFVIKYDSSGVKQFTLQLGSFPEQTLATAVAVDGNGNLFVTGSTNGGLDGNVQTGPSDFFITKYDSSGVKQFTRQLGFSFLDTVAHSVATDANGNVYVTGHTSGNFDQQSMLGVVDCFVTKYDSNGVKQFTRLLGVAGTYTIGESVTTDAAGNVYVAGYTFGGMDGNTKIGTIDLFVTKYNSSGAKQFTRQLGANGGETRAFAVTTANGTVYVAGTTNRGLNGNAGVGSTDSFIASYDAVDVRQ